jgi:FixJ family two-component response regulator
VLGSEILHVIPVVQLCRDGPVLESKSILELIHQQIDLDCRHNRFCQQNKTTKAIHNRLTERPVDVLDKAVVDIPPDNQTRE